MKILIDARMYGLEHAGIGRYLINLIANLEEYEKEDDYTVLLRKKYFNELKFPDNWKKVEADFRHYTFTEQLRLPGIIYKEKPDLVHFPHLNFPIFWKGKYVITVHDLTMQYQGSDATTLSAPIYYLKRIPFLLASKLAVKNANKIIVPSEFVKKDVIKYYSIDSDKVKVVYEGVTAFGEIPNSQFSIFKILEKNKISKRYFLYVGNAYPHKNLRKAVEATIFLNRKTKSKVMLVIGGSKDVFKERLQEEIRKLKAEKYVTQLGYISDQELCLLYKYSSGFVYPSLSEGFGLQGLEAISAGTLLLASNISVFKEIYSDFAFFFDPGDATSIASLMKYVLEMDGDKRSTVIRKSQEYIKKYSWQKMARETSEIYTKVYEEIGKMGTT